MKRAILTIIVLLCLTAIAQAAGPTVSFMTEQVASVDKGNSLGIELGYFLGVDDSGPGLEPYIGCDWWPRWDDDGDMSPPSVVVLGARQWFSDIVDSNSIIPFIPQAFLAVLNEEIEIKPYISFRFSANIVDKDAGVMSIPAGITVKTSPTANSALRFEIRYSDTFGVLNVVPDNKFDYYMGIYIPF